MAFKWSEGKPPFTEVLRRKHSNAEEEEVKPTATGYYVKMLQQDAEDFAPPQLREADEKK